MKSRILTLGILLFSAAAPAMTLDWAGTYRFEWMQVDRPSLGTPGWSKAYGLNYLRLSPKIIATDGVTIHSAFDVLANEDAAYTNQQFGQLWGQSLPAGADDSRSNTLSQTKGTTTLRVSELYMHVQQEYGSLIVGRAPYEFGLGISYNAGRGLFDHWHTSMDLVGYKFIVGNLSFMPMIGRVAAADAGLANTVQDQIFEFLYDSKDTGSTIGAVISRRQSSPGNNDTPFSAAPKADMIGGAGATRADAYSMQTTSFILKREWESFKFRMEGSFLSGSYGVRTLEGDEVKNNSYGIAMEMDFPRPEGKWDASVRLGVASGDDPKTKDNWEGFTFHRNYDVAMLLFNHRLGGADFLRTNLIKDTSVHDVSNSLDDEAISNAVYLSPKIRYGWSERWDIVNSLTYAQLMVNPTNSVDFKKDLGLEWDIGLIYKPRENMRWENQLGLLFPGAAFKDGTVDRPNGFTYGFSTRAAITF
ncbi:MAG: hypothetical protein KF802_06975 [Bdellovibrionaceae bacterium]|nr:hypothetical protein [Pseudobdellovibrionaceae bacterium]MBX3034353.1 hypothetical protein [Pseudobdellovibrionaceae bacterium]